MPDFEKIIGYIEAILKLIFGDQVPAWVFRSVGYILLIALVLLGIWGLLLILSKIKNLWTEHFWPLFYNPEEKRRGARRQRFADHIESEIRRLNNLEEWRDYRFAELEAEVEAQGRWQVFGIFPFLQRTRSGLRRERSLSKALESSQDRLILLEGEPGSGKSVALRHVAQAMARRAMKARNTRSVIPIYINLKELVRHRKEAIDRNLIYSFVLRSLNRVNDRDIEEFLEEEFDHGLREGTWLFLFDSFDEIPEVLSSTEADTAIRSYADAISDFLYGMNQCRGIIASRQFRGPGQFGWSRFRILPLSDVRCSELIRKADLKPELERNLMGQLGMARQEIRAMTSNPMFLGLLCEHMRSGNPFPENVHSIFETYIETRFTRDEDRLWQRFRLKPAEVRTAAESLAFCMAADPGLGLSPTRESLEDATVRLGLWAGKRFDTLLDALEYIKLARSETATAAGESKPFTFAHRRFQEYFATCVVLREPDQVSPRQLLTDARWRETAVAMCQTQPLRVLSPILREARNLLTEMSDSVPGLIDEPLEYVRACESTDQDKGSKEASLPEPFTWPSGALHVLGLLQDGFGSRLKELPDDIRTNAGGLVLSASEAGTLSDKKWGLEVAGIAPQPILLYLLQHAFASESQWLKEVAYRQVARLRGIPAGIASGIRRALVDLFASRRLRRERHATRAHLARLDKSAGFHSVLRLLLLIPFVDLALHLVGIISVLAVCIWGASLSTLEGLALVTFLLISHLSLRWLPYLRGYRDIRGVLGTLAVVIRALSGTTILLALLALMPSLQDANIATKASLFVISLLWYSLAVWAPFALLSGWTGQFTHPLWWPLMPMWPLLYSARNAKESVVVTFAWLRKHWRSVTIWSLMTIGLGGSVFLLSQVRAGLLVSTILGWLLLVVLCIAMLGSTFLWINDWARWHRWTQSHQAAITAQDLIELLSQYHKGRFHIWLVRAVREKGLLVTTEDTEAMLERLAIAIEHAILAEEKEIKEQTKRPDIAVKRALIGLKTRLSRRKDRLPEQLTSALSDSGIVERQLAEYMKNKRRFLSVRAEFLDEICKLLAQLRARRWDRE